MSELWPWAMLALLGAYHGINPGMGWLFAVSLGLQEKSRGAVVRAFAPIAIGHFASIAAVVAVVATLRVAVSPDLLRTIGGAGLIGFGIYKLAAPMSHPRWVGMRVGARQLALWSFLMATAHGAGLMVMPVVIRMGDRAAESRVEAAPPQSLHSVSLATPVCADCPESRQKSAGAVTPTPDSSAVPACHAQIGKMAGGGAGVVSALAGVGLHTLAMFLAMGVTALVVYDRVGLRILRTAWVNLDLLWAFALIGAGALTLIL